jgi:hypothetical protein
VGTTDIREFDGCVGKSAAVSIWRAAICPVIHGCALDFFALFSFRVIYQPVSTMIFAHGGERRFYYRGAGLWTAALNVKLSTFTTETFDIGYVGVQISMGTAYVVFLFCCYAVTYCVGLATFCAIILRCTFAFFALHSFRVIYQPVSTMISAQGFGRRRHRGALCVRKAAEAFICSTVT